ncbi:unnamed protein product [Aphis gossypii]|uniref:Mitochondrial import receptor subunit TOM22 homolog n=1 Tax=Aphis gossypii TaxID=80765 RepID=A0A9P0IZM2_APHGO|nr:unnamed protein product [Aphis gossypii]
MTTAEDLELSDSDKVQPWSTDSGMESMTDSNKDVTPMSENFDDDEEDETLGERLWALTEMFPDSLRKGTEKLVNTAGKAIVGKKLVPPYHELLNNARGTRWPCDLRRWLRRSRSLVRSAVTGWHFSSGKSRCPKNKCRHPPPRGMAETYGCPIRNSAK